MMKTKLYLILKIIILLICSNLFGQISKYNFKREVIGQSEQWHKIILPDDIYSNISNNLQGIRIYGINNINDTIEAPYLLNFREDELEKKSIDFKIINQSKNENDYYFTFELPITTSINLIQLDFNQQNFDWRLKLEGSQNLKDWFLIEDNYRILSIKNENTNYSYTELNFPESNYKYFRIAINSKEEPDLEKASIYLNNIKQGNFKNYKIKSQKITENKQFKQTIIDFELDFVVPLSFLKIFVKSDFDFYRHIEIQYLIDSVQTQSGWEYNYSTIATHTLTSIDTDEFKFSSTFAKKLRAIIYNYDNIPLEIDSISVGGFVYELTARFVEQGKYFLTYGNMNADKPYYDIENFSKNIPNSLKILELGPEIIINKHEIVTTSPFFQNKIWLWSIMILIIFVLGWFSFKMMKGK